MVSLREAARVRTSNPALKRVKRNHKKLYAALLTVRMDQTILTRRQKERPLTLAECEELQRLAREHKHLQEQIEQLTHKLWALTGTTDTADTLDL